MHWGDEHDMIVVGTGGAALTAAVTASWRGLKTLVVEKTSTWGGTTAYSGGGVWIPANPIQLQEGPADSFEDALRYLDDIVGKWARRVRLSGGGHCSKAGPR